MSDVNYSEGNSSFCNGYDFSADVGPSVEHLQGAGAPTDGSKNENPLTPNGAVGLREEASRSRMEERGEPQQRGSHRCCSCCCSRFAAWIVWLLVTLLCCSVVVNIVLGSLRGTGYWVLKRKSEEELPAADGTLEAVLSGTLPSVGGRFQGLSTQTSSSAFDLTSVYNTFTSVTVAATLQLSGDTLAAMRSVGYRDGSFATTYNNTASGILVTGSFTGASIPASAIVPYLQKSGYLRAVWMAGRLGLQLTCRETASKKSADVSLGAVNAGMSKFMHVATGPAASTKLSGLMQRAMEDATNRTVAAWLWNMMSESVYTSADSLSFCRNSTASWDGDRDAVIVGTAGQTAVGPAPMLQPLDDDGMLVMVEMHQRRRWAPTFATFVVARCQCPSGDEHTLVAKESVTLRFARTHTCAVVPVEALLTGMSSGLVLLMVPRLLMGVPAYVRVGPPAQMTMGDRAAISALNSNTDLLSCLHNMTVLQTPNLDCSAYMKD